MIRPMTQGDVARVAEIHVFAQRGAYRGIVPDEFLFGKMSVAARIKYFGQNKYEAYVWDDGIIRGFVTMGLCEDADNKGAFELYRIFIDPFMQGGGLGRKLAAHFEHCAARHGHKDICLWALAGNTRAAAFYEHLGYRKDGATRISGYFGVTENRFAKEIRDQM